MIESNLWVTPEELGGQSDSSYAMEACKTASFLLWGLSGRKFSGMTQVTEVYTPAQEGIDIQKVFEVPTTGHLIYQFFANPHRPNTVLDLRGSHVLEILSITVDGDIVDPLDYWVTNHKSLHFRSIIRGDIEVEYIFGSMPPMAGRMAAKALAQQFALSFEGSDECALPDRVTSVTRQGISYTLLDRQDFIEDLRTGVYAVDLFLKTVNPNKALRRARVFSPDSYRARRTT